MFVLVNYLGLTSYHIVVLSNQGGVSLRGDPKTVKSDQKRLSEFKAKAGSVFAQLDIPIALYAATARDRFRKPRVGMWRELLEDCDLDIGDGPDLQNSIFVGDAAGRPARPGRKADHSSSDRSVCELGTGRSIHEGLTQLQRLRRQCRHSIPDTRGVFPQRTSRTLHSILRTQLVSPCSHRSFR